MRKLLIAFVGSALILGVAIHPQPSVSAVKEEHCTAKLEAGSGKIAEYRCFARFSEAIAHATAGQVELAADAPSGKLAPETFAALQSQTVIGIDYDNAGYSGTSLTWYVQNSFGCLGGWSYFVDFMPSGWNDRGLLRGGVRRLRQLAPLREHGPNRNDDSVQLCFDG